MSSPSVNSGRWREAYGRSRRSLFGRDRRDLAQQLARVGVMDLPRTARILDFGCGDGNTLRFLEQAGFSRVVGLEPDLALLRGEPSSAPARVAARGPRLPFRTGAFDAVISLGVLHHLPDRLALEELALEFARALRTGGSLHYVEPAETVVRSILTPLLLSPLGRVTEFSRQKRVMVEEEWDTLNSWLEDERGFGRTVLKQAGLEVVLEERSALRVYLRANAV